MSYDKAYAGGWQDGSSGMTPINAAALNHMEEGIEAASEPKYKWQHLSDSSYTVTIAANSGTTYTFPNNITMPLIDDYTRFVVPRTSNSQIVATGWSFDSDGHLSVYLRNLTSSSATVYVRAYLIYLRNDLQWT